MNEDFRGNADSSAGLTGAQSSSQSRGSQAIGVASSSSMQIRSEGFVKIHRNILKHHEYGNPFWAALWLHLLLHAAYEPRKARFGSEIITLQPGQLITGRKVLARETGISENIVRRLLDVMENDQQIHQVTCAVSRLITIINWGVWQTNHQVNHQHLTNESPAINQQITTLKELKKERMEESSVSGAAPPIELPPGFPKTEDEAKAGCLSLGIPDDFILKSWLYAYGRGGLDSRGQVIRFWPRHVQGLWLHDQGRQAEQKTLRQNSGQQNKKMTDEKFEQMIDRIRNESGNNGW